MFNMAMHAISVVLRNCIVLDDTLPLLVWPSHLHIQLLKACYFVVIGHEPA